MTPSCRVTPPLGAERKVLLEGQAEATVSQWLEQLGFPLNTRCGGRGRCRGCTVQLDAENVKACQLTLQDLYDGASIGIPSTSWRDERVHGVRAFELRVPLTPTPGRSGVGLALDLGTTTLAAALWDLADGRCLATASCSNPQRRIGDDVITRIAFAIDQSDGVTQLQTALVEHGIRPLLRRLFRQSKHQPSDLDSAIVVGNPAILHTLMGAPLDGLGSYPFVPALADAVATTLGTLGLESSARCLLPAPITPFVGADLTAGAVALGLQDATSPTLLIDFGTNGEILLATPQGTWATATAVGPAFEGGRLSAGITAQPEAISHLSLTESLVWEIELVGTQAKEATGITGAAYIDALAALQRVGAVGPRGRMRPEHPLVQMRTDPDGEPEHAVEIAPTLFLNEADIAELLQAKAAIGAGVATLLAVAEVQISELATVYVAGGFGYHLDPANALAVGLLPPLSLEKIELVGNTALGGASCLVLAPRGCSAPPYPLPLHAVELNLQPDFEDHYVDHLSFGWGDED